MNPARPGRNQKIHHGGTETTEITEDARRTEDEPRGKQIPGPAEGGVAACGDRGYATSGSEPLCVLCVSVVKLF